MTLSHHTVIGVTTAAIGSEYLRPVGRNSFRGQHGSGGSHTVYVVETDRGATGWGVPLAGVGDPSAVIGRNLAELIDPAVGVIDPAAQLLDYPLHDLAAKVLDLPVHAMLRPPDAGHSADTAARVRCYSGAIYFDDLDPADAPDGLAAVERNLAQDHEAGFRDFKLKIGRGYRWMTPADGMRRDIEVTRLARERYPDAAILVDANDGFSVNDLSAYLAAVADCDLYWLEEPFAERLEDLRWLRDHLSAADWPIRIADGEFQPIEQHVLRLATEGLLDVALMDVVGFGLTAWRRIMPELQAARTKGSPHAWGWPIKTLYAAHLAVGLGNIDIVEGVPGRILGTDGQGYRLADGVITLSDRPGFGIELADRAAQRVR